MSSPSSAFDWDALASLLERMAGNLMQHDEDINGLHEVAHVQATATATVHERLKAVEAHCVELAKENLETRRLLVKAVESLRETTQMLVVQKLIMLKLFLELGADIPQERWDQLTNQFISQLDQNMAKTRDERQKEQDGTG